MSDSVPGPRPATCCLVTGALGFVGRHLVEALLLDGVPVVGIGKHRPGAPLPVAVGPFRRGPDAPDLPGAVSYRADAGRMWYVPLALEDPAPIADLVARLQPVSIYHLAAQSSAAVSFADPAETFTSNVMGTLSLLEAVRATPPPQRPVVLSIGSCEEYGPQPAGAFPLDEAALPAPVSPYGVSKVGQTLLCRQYALSYDLPVVMTRSFSHTGPGQDTRFAFPSFARQIAAAEAGQGSREIRTGDLGAVRDFLDVRDVVAAYRLLTSAGRPGEIYNVSSGRALTIQDGLDILVAAARVPVAVTRDPARDRPSDIPVMVGDNTKLRNATGWKPARDFTATLLGLLDEARREYT